MHTLNATTKERERERERKRERERERRDNKHSLLFIIIVYVSECVHACLCHNLLVVFPLLMLTLMLTCYPSTFTGYPPHYNHSHFNIHVHLHTQHIYTYHVHDTHVDTVMHCTVGSNCLSFSF